MARCKITNFVIGVWRFETDGNRQTASVLDPDSHLNYTLVECSLTKEMLKPHEFTFTLRRNVIEKSDDFKHYKIVNNILGKKVVCAVEVNPFDDSAFDSKLEFTGIIEKVFVKGLNIIGVAHTPDTKMQGTPQCRCFTNVKLEDVVNAIVPDTLDKKVSIHDYVQPCVFPYIIQYNESDYDFLARLAKRFGAFMYYGQKQFVFGKIPCQPGQSIVQFNIEKPSCGVSYEFQTGDPNYKFEGYYYDGDRVLKNTSSLGYDIWNSEKLVKMASDNSEKFDSDSIYGIDDPNSYPNDPPDDYENFYSWVTMAGDLSNMVTCTFTTYLFSVELGDVVIVNDNGPMMVTSLHLTWDCNGSPKNEVTAKVLPHNNMDADDLYPPYMDFNAYPKSSAQRAVVVNNVDAKGMGRVQVRFVWQPENMSDDDKKKLPWIRIAQPYGGNKKGCFILPEIDEEVMVGFEHENMEKPFVIGTLFHSSNDDQKKQLPAEGWCEVPAKDGNPAKNEENEVKAFRTKKGHTIEFHDTKQGDGFIRIYGNESKKPNYDIILSTDPIKVGDNKDQDYEVESASADKDECKDKFKAEKLRIMVCSNGGDIVLDAGVGDIVMNAQNIRLHAKGDRTAYVEGKDVVKVDDVRFVKTNESRFYVDADQIVHVEDEDQYSSKKLKIDVDNAIEVAAQSLTSKTDQKTEIKAASIAAEANQDVAVTAKTELKLDGGSYAKMSANNLDVESNINAMLSSANTTVEGKATLNLKTAKGGRTGLWSDGAV